jgi:transposase
MTTTILKMMHPSLQRQLRKTRYNWRKRSPSPKNQKLQKSSTYLWAKNANAIKKRRKAKFKPNKKMARKNAGSLSN